MQDFIISFMENYGYLGIVFLIFIENIFPPIPSEIILTFGGFMTTVTSMTLPGVIFVASIGSVLGALALYGIGRSVGEDRFKRFVDKTGSKIGFGQEDIQKAYSWYEKYGYWSVFLCRMVPIVRSLISVPAGLLEMRVLPFVLYTAAGSLLWNTLLVSAGALLGENWAQVMDFTARYDKVMFALMVALVLYGGYRFYRSRQES